MKKKLLCTAALFGLLSSAWAQNISITPGNINVNDTGTSISVRGDGNPQVTVNSGQSGQTKNTKRTPGTSHVVIEDGGSVSVTAVGEGAHAETNIGSRTISAGSSGKQISGNKKSYINEDLSARNLSKHDLSGYTFTNVSMNATVLSKANLQKAQLTNVDLSGADLRGANLAGASITNVDLEDALLDGTIWIDGRTCKTGSVGACR